MDTYTQDQDKKRSFQGFRGAVLTVLILLFAPVLAAEAELVLPHSPDAQTLHLWHMDEAAVPIRDAATNGVDLTALENGATLGSESYTARQSLGTALCTYTGNPSLPPGCAGQGAYLAPTRLTNGPGDNVALKYAGPAGAFTYEAIVRIDFNPTADFGPQGWGRGRSLFMQILCADADENASRVFQFRLAPVGTLNGNTQPLLEFINLNTNSGVQSLTAPIPTEGPEAIRSGNWYHLAVVYDGRPDQADNLRFYWALLEPLRTAANLIGTQRMAHSLPEGCEPDFAIGQTGRQSPVTPMPDNNFVGLIDEVRMSGVARSANQMAFAPRPASLAVNSTGAPSAAGNPGATSRSLARLGTAVEPASAAGSGLALGLTIQDGAVSRGPVDRPRIALVFSCRLADADTRQILTTLKAHGAKASFFVTSDFLQWPLNTMHLPAILADGHYVGPESDGWTTSAEARSSPAQGNVQAILPQMEAHLRQLSSLGVERKSIRFFLPTEDQFNPGIARAMVAYGLTMIAGTPGTLSYATATVEGTRQFVSSRAVLNSIAARERSDPSGLNGFLLLFQLDSGTRRGDRFWDHFGELLDTLGQRGYQFVRVDQLLGRPAALYGKLAP